MFTRRQFLQLCAKGAFACSLTPTFITKLSQAMENIDKKPVVIWLETNTCAGNIFSFLNTLNPSLRQLLFESLQLRFSNTLMTAQGEQALDILEKTMDEGDYILMVEGTIPTKAEGHYGILGIREGKPVTHLEMVNRLAEKANYIIAVGTCASFGGPYAAHPNPSGSVPLSEAIGRETINVSGCPPHPDWIVGTLTHVILFGMPRLGVHNRPTMFYGENIHHRCPRRQMFNSNQFAEKPGDEGCLYLIGCKGPVTSSDCPTRQWISQHHSWPVEANTPCIGCVNADFPEKSMPFFEHLPDQRIGGVNIKAGTFQKIVAGGTALAIGTHFVANLASGRLKQKLLKTERNNKRAVESADQRNSEKFMKPDDSRLPGTAEGEEGFVEMAEEMSPIIDKSIESKETKKKIKRVVKSNLKYFKKPKKLGGQKDNHE